MLTISFFELDNLPLAERVRVQFHFLSFHSRLQEPNVAVVADVNHWEISRSCPIRFSMDPVQHLAWRSVAPEEVKAAWTRSGVANDR